MIWNYSYSSFRSECYESFKHCCICVSAETDEFSESDYKEEDLWWDCNTNSYYWVSEAWTVTHASSFVYDQW